MPSQGTTAHVSLLTEGKPISKGKESNDWTNPKARNNFKCYVAGLNGGTNTASSSARLGVRPQGMNFKSDCINLSIATVGVASAFYLSNGMGL